MTTDQLTGRALPQPNLPPGFKVDGMMPCGMWRVQTPLEFPDGSLIDVFWGRSDSGRFFATDLGSATNWLDMIEGECTVGRKEAVEACEADLGDGEIIRYVYSEHGEGDAVAIFCVAMAQFCLVRTKKQLEATHDE